ncbi:hypothetical protein TNCV_3408861 [Trichonephila clavipes]|nr:hypothetical protein TNCV_3408861 [Trichonephila clavipes]
MAVPMSICTKKKRREVIRFLFAEGLKLAEIIHHMQGQYGESCLPQTPCHDEFRGLRSDYVSQGLGSNPGEGMDVCECILPLRHGGTLNSGQAASPHVRLVEGSGRPLTILRVFGLKIEVEPRQIVLSPVWFSKLRLTTDIKI